VSLINGGGAAGVGAMERMKNRARRWRRAAALGLLLSLVAPVFAAPEAGSTAAAPTAAAGDASAPPVQTLQLPDLSSRTALSSSIQILVLMTVLAVAPSIVLMTTCFVRMVVVLALLRQAIGTQGLPPTQVVAGLALFLTLLVMAPTAQRINERAIKPYMAGMGQAEALQVAGEELRGFMFAQIEACGNEQDIYMMQEYATQQSLPAGAALKRADVPTVALMPAFMLSELKTAFIMGFKIYLPFLVIDMVISTVLVSMGMMMLPPVLISLPFKLLLFVLADGWHLVVGSLMASVA
jgi:flagellar biosynthetic protein FliP